MKSEQSLDWSRREFIKSSVAGGVTSMLLAGQIPAAEPARNAPMPAKLKIVCVGGHPDDPESGCAGTLARYADLGHSVAVIYLTRGERGIRGKELEETAAIRTEEAKEACKLMGARAVFAGQIDGATEINKTRVEELSRLIAAEAPDVLFTHWPIDTHMDHQAASMLTFRSYLALSKKPQLAFFEVNTGSQTEGFFPNTYVDISSVVERKKSALFAHKSQNGEAIWKQHHEIVANFRGREAGCKAAEAFVQLNRAGNADRLPGL
jgi:LmbE family N-acetylglucosaminyl deacetylase